jgi:hypothetical protein
LDDNRYLVREQATRQLLAAGEAALEPLLAAANSERPEPADRAIWVLRRLGASKDVALRRKALERLAQVKNRPRVAAAARQALAEFRHREAIQALEQLGARFGSPQFGGEGSTEPHMTVRVILDRGWRGGDEGLVHLGHLLGLQQVIVIGTDLSVAGLAKLQKVEMLEELWLYGTNLHAEDLPEIKKLLPQVTVDYRRGALLGVGGNSFAGEGPAQVMTVTAGGAAALAGIKVGDIIQKFEGEPVASFKDLTVKIGKCSPGDEVKLQLLRDGKPLTLTVKLGEWQTI